MNRTEVSIRFHHPSRDLQFFSDVLGITAYTSRVAGEPMRTPYGHPVKGIINKESYWVAILRPETGEKVGPTLNKAIDLLRTAETAMRGHVASGGRISLYIYLAGDTNDGCDIEPRLLAFMADLGVTLGIEVFPN